MKSYCHVVLTHSKVKDRLNYSMSSVELQINTGLKTEPKDVKP